MALPPLHRPFSAMNAYPMVSDILHKMHVISVPKLLKLERMQPHQELLREGALAEWNESMRGRTIFVSHQWTGYDEPDSGGFQLRALQQALNRLWEGKTDVENHWIQQLIFKKKGLVRGAEWAKMIPEMYVWVDYLSMAQPSAGPMPWQTDEQVGEEHVGSPRHEDHRHGGGDAVKCLNDGVASLPGYVELSDIILVLVPPTAHTDRAGEVCDFATWRGRGWCRLEYMAAMLSPSENRVLVVHGGGAKIEFIPSYDALLLLPGHGEFSCCARKHDFGDGPVPCDRPKILHVLQVLLKGKISALFKKGKVFEARYFAVLDHWWYRGLCEQEVGHRAAAEEAAMGGLGSFLPLSKKASMRGVDVVDCLIGLKEVLRWGSDTDEEAEIQKTGMSLLSWAVLDNNLPAVVQLLPKGGSAAQVSIGSSFRSAVIVVVCGCAAAPWYVSLEEWGQEKLALILIFYLLLVGALWLVLTASSSDKKLVNQGLKMNFPELTFRCKMTPLHLAMRFSQVGIVEALLEAGANPNARDANGLTAVHWAAFGGMTDNIAAWLERFPKWDLEQRDTVTGGTAVQYAVGIGPCKLETVRFLLDAGADIRTRNHAGATLLLNAAANLNIGAEHVLRLLLGRAPDLLNMRFHPTTVKWKSIQWVARFVVKHTWWSKSKTMNEIAAWEGSTPLVRAVNNFNLPMLRILCASPGIEQEAYNAQGHTGLEVAEAVFGGSPPAEYVELLLQAGQLERSRVRT